MPNVTENASVGRSKRKKRPPESSCPRGGEGQRTFPGAIGRVSTAAFRCLGAGRFGRQQVSVGNRRLHGSLFPTVGPPVRGRCLTSYIRSVPPTSMWADKRFAARRNDAWAAFPVRANPRGSLVRLSGRAHRRCDVVAWLLRRREYGISRSASRAVFCSS